jgi:hypothetical protein
MGVLRLMLVAGVLVAGYFLLRSAIKRQAGAAAGQPERDGAGPGLQDVRAEGIGGDG